MMKPVEQCPVWPKIKEQWPNVNPKTICISYYPDIYCERSDLDPDFLAHEQVHLDQQKEYGVEAWWHSYLTDQSFRLAEETEAYREQGKYIKENWRGTMGKKMRRLTAIATDFSGPIYGNMISYDEAFSILLNEQTNS